MRKLSFGVGTSAQMTRAEAPVAPAWQPPRRRLGDAIEDAFRIALDRGSVMIAEDLLGVMENIRAIDRVKAPAERRRQDAAIERARSDLALRRAGKYLQPFGVLQR